MQAHECRPCVGRSVCQLRVSAVCGLFWRRDELNVLISTAGSQACRHCIHLRRRRGVRPPPSTRAAAAPSRRPAWQGHPMTPSRSKGPPAGWPRLPAQLARSLPIDVLLKECGRGFVRSIMLDNTANPASRSLCQPFGILYPDQGTHLAASAAAHQVLLCMACQAAL